MNKIKTDRIFGLDLLRAIAIFLVVFSHAEELIPNIPFNSSTINLPDGVDLFFVLSGYLIGLILLKTIENHKTINTKITINFLIRRWFRTLPNYFLFLLINITLVYFTISPGKLNKHLITFFCFFQNFYKPYDFLFWESWSLSIEEWFYLSFPIILLALFKISSPTNYTTRKNLILTGIFLFLFLPLIYRLTHYSPSLNTDLFFRKLVLTRLDAIGYGLLAAYMHFYHNSFWQKNKNILFIFGITATIALLNFNPTSIFFKQTFYYTLTSLSIALLLPKLNSFSQKKSKLNPITLISKISYSMYLAHLPILFILLKILPENSNYIFILYWFLTISISYFIFKYYETPLTNLRNKVKIPLN